MTQLAFELEGIRPIVGLCADGGSVHVLAPCGHCTVCGAPLLSIMSELGHRCTGHEVAS
jgi:hypothetical protein